MEMIENVKVDTVKAFHSNGQAMPVPEQTHCTCCGAKATLFVGQVSAEGKVISKAFCLLHALKEGLFHPKGYDLLSTGSTLHRPQAELTCQCGTTASLIKAKGKVGCAHCYTTFKDLINPLLPKIHSASVHAGKAPKKLQEKMLRNRRITQLRETMDKAIKAEAYEQAAVVRDQLEMLNAKR